MARAAPTATERAAYFELLGGAKDNALAQKALDFALTGESGTSSAQIMGGVAAEHADLAFDFALANRAGVEALVESFSRYSFVAGLASASRDPAMIGKLERFRDASPEDERREVERRIAQVRNRLATEPRLSREVGEWLVQR